MTIGEVVTSGLTIMGKHHQDPDYVELQDKALELIRGWSVYMQRLYTLYAKSNGLQLKYFLTYDYNDEFVYGRDLAPAASLYIAMIMAPENELFRSMHDAVISELHKFCATQIAETIDKYPM